MNTDALFVKINTIYNEIGFTCIMWFSTLLIVWIVNLSVSEGGNSKLVIRAVTRPSFETDGPHWDDRKQILYYQDIGGRTVHAYKPSTRRHTSITLDSRVSITIPIKGYDDKFVIGNERNISVLRWDSQSEHYSVQPIFTVDRDKPDNLLNDGKADAKGRLWIGSKGPDSPEGGSVPYRGTLFRLNRSCRLDGVVAPVSVSNGIAWNSRNTVMYYVDSDTLKVDAFDYNIETGQIVNRRTFFDVEAHNINGRPDGITMDTNDNLWLAIVRASRVIQISPRGELLRTVFFPTTGVSSCTFGGEGLRTLYVTTLQKGLSQEQLLQQPLAGSVFAVDGLGVTGTRGREVTPCLART